MYSIVELKRHMGPKKAKSRPESENAGHGPAKWESAIALAPINEEVTINFIYIFAMQHVLYRHQN